MSSWGSAADNESWVEVAWTGVAAEERGVAAASSDVDAGGKIISQHDLRQRVFRARDLSERVVGVDDARETSVRVDGHFKQIEHVAGARRAGDAQGAESHRT